MAKRFNKHQIDALESAFKESMYLTKRKKIELVKATGLDVEQIASWFSRIRAVKRAKKSVGDLERTKVELQEALQGSKEREAKLKNELEGSKRHQTELYAENQRLRQQLGVTGNDAMFDPIASLLNRCVCSF
ncbi:hypothetical protein CDL12_01727 [Handroanthus impetiginosus]|uniref:Homeobox domain-containing protein n=1 Tax=Handroanthus impetiginosus TaxID=429701 RepID=A0A2G9I714_9LAMI|nr:hypothetical protein CDL12_01727 [Handroanthus impetiginosus]